MDNSHSTVNDFSSIEKIKCPSTVNSSPSWTGFAPRLEQRLVKELKILTEDPDIKSYFHYESSRQDDELKQFCIDGYLLPQTEPYKRGSYKVRIILPPEFPYISPKLNLLTYIYHPAVNKDVSGPTFCGNCCSFEFKPTFHINEFIKYYVDIIDRPDLFYRTCTYNCEARELYDQNKAGYEEKALIMVSNYACPRPN